MVFEKENPAHAELLTVQVMLKWDRLPADDDHAIVRVVVATRQDEDARDEEHWVTEREAEGAGMRTTATVGSGPHDPPEGADRTAEAAASAVGVLVASDADAMRSSVRGLSSRGSETSGIALETGFPSGGGVGDAAAR